MNGLNHSRCSECGAHLAHDQRYCLDCGARRGALPAAVVELIATATNHVREPLEAYREDEQPAGWNEPTGVSMPTPAVAAVAVMALLAFGVLVGSAVSPVAPSTAATPTLVALAPPARTPIEAPASASATPPSGEETPTPETSEAEPASSAETTPANATKPAKKASGEGTSKAGGGGGGSTPSGSGLPPIKHVFMIVLSDEGETTAFGQSSSAPYLAKTLTGQGELLENYYAVSGGELANAIALISGQGPTPQTAGDCPQYTSLTPGTLGAEGQALGSGCVYPASTLTLADQLTAAGKTWKAYVEGIEAGAPALPASCRHPTLGASDPSNAPSAGDAYVTWRNPFVYFSSLTGGPQCARDDVGLPQLTSDLKAASTTPSLAYIAPDPCDDGSPTPCAPGAPAGLAPAEAFLRKVVPEIEASAAYKEGGLIAITFDQAPQSGAGADSSGCCITSAYPNLPATGAPTTGTATTPATTPTSTSTSTTTSTTPSATTPASATTPTSTSTSTTTSTTPSATAPAAATPTPAAATPTTGAAGPSATQTSTPTGGGKVGLLLISEYVKPGSLNVIGEYDHFSLLRSVENLFGLKPLGYAAAPGLPTFDSGVFDAGG